MKHLKQTLKAYKKKKEKSLLKQIEQSLKEVKLIREGKLPQRTLQQMIDDKEK